MLSAPRAELSEPFCSYCGYPPPGPWRRRAHRVCRRCQMGVVLRAPPNEQPRCDDPFVIVDQELTVQAVSQQAEVALRVEEPTGVGVPLEELLVYENGDSDGFGLSSMVQEAIAGHSMLEIRGLRAVGDPERRLVARVVSCGPPTAALLILGQPEGERSGSANGGGGSGAVGSDHDGAPPTQRRSQ